METLNQNDAGIFIITDKNDKKYIGVSMELKRKIEQIQKTYCEVNDYKNRKLNLEILYKCHRNLKGILQTKPFLQAMFDQLTVEHKAKKINKDLDSLFAKIKKIEVKSKYIIRKKRTENKSIKEPKKKKIISEEQKAIISEAQTGRKHTQESKLKRSIALKGKPLKEETKAKMRKPKSAKTTQTQDHVEKRVSKNLGKKRSKGTKAKMSEAGKIAQNRPEVIAKKSAALTGRKLSEGTKAKMSEVGKGKNKGVKQTAEHIAKRVETKKLKKNENTI